MSHRYALQLSNGTAQPAVEELGWRIGYGSFATVGAVIVSRRPRNRIGWMLCVVGLTSGVAGFAQDYATWALVDRPKWLPGGLVMGWLGSWPWYIAFGLIITFLPLLFPDGRLPSRRWRPVAWLAGDYLALHCLWAAFAPRPLEGPTPLPQNPWAIEGAEGFFRLLDTCISVLLPTVVLLCLASLVVRFRRSTGVQRQQLKWFTYAAPLASAPGPCSPPPGWTSGYRARCGRCSPWSAAGRSRRRSGSRGCATGSMALTGCSTAPWSSGCSPPWPWPPCSSPPGAASRRRRSALQPPPLRRRQDLEAFSVHLRDQVDLDTLAAELLAVVDQTVQPTRASLWLRPRRVQPAVPPR